MLVPHGVYLTLAHRLQLLHSFCNFHLLRSFSGLQMLHGFRHLLLYARKARLHLRMAMVQTVHACRQDIGYRVCCLYLGL